ncbi:hypothetical protein LB535_20860 [Mesorhizobium sp. CA10]|uniref:hypothetical protein n=1 Tax=Mesorhizobium sp. CA10 TaxID=588495 RepID=UPI001CCA6A42|nr:hypothetical protein [Mesorhizobium sp. CA10]MBZ9884802.1 hypothetical protein [Mesorhizobium sp. CA10]
MIDVDPINAAALNALPTLFSGLLPEGGNQGRCWVACNPGYVKISPKRAAWRKCGIEDGLAYLSRGRRA